MDSATQASFKQTMWRTVLLDAILIGKSAETLKNYGLVIKF